VTLPKDTAFVGQNNFIALLTISNYDDVYCKKHCW